MNSKRGPYFLPGVKGARVYSFGPPKDEALLLSLDPRSNEEFKLALDGPARSLFSAASLTSSADPSSPFNARHGSKLRAKRRPAGLNAAQRDFYSKYYVKSDEPAEEDWQSIGSDWMQPTEQLALRLNSEVNNTSLVIAIELPQTGKVLFFTGDAQRGNWISWKDLSWTLGNGTTVTARDLLARTVFYKVGHHGSHNATLKGTAADEFPNLGWMGLGEMQNEFVAMIPSNEKWALARRPWPWRHPLKAIDEALKDNARGRVLQTNINSAKKPSYVSAGEWKKFTQRLDKNDLYFDLTISDE
ncbi:MAG: hypothetical protein GY761_09700 [Hyphomicrobiales bacterium]|nr:hypothetical protein [Hyphomicrobiales bacterium]